MSRQHVKAGDFFFTVNLCGSKEKKGKSNNKENSCLHKIEKNKPKIVFVLKYIFSNLFIPKCSKLNLFCIFSVSVYILKSTLKTADGKNHIDTERTNYQFDCLFGEAQAGYDVTDMTCELWFRRNNTTNFVLLNQRISIQYLDRKCLIFRSNVFENDTGHYKCKVYYPPKSLPSNESNSEFLGVYSKILLIHIN